MIERIEVLKDGASTQYGSDAIGGVINIITKKDFNGVQIDLHYGFGLDSGDYTEQRYAATLGYSKDGTKIVAGGQYYKSDPIYTKDRYPGGLGAQALANLDIRAPTYFSPSYPGRISSWLLAGSSLAQGAPGYIAGLNAPPNDAYIMAHGPYNDIPSYNAAVMSDPAWTHPGLAPYIPITSTPTSQALGGSTSILNTTLLNTITVQEQDRKQAFANLEQEIFKDTLSVYGQILYSETESTGQLAPAPIPNLTLYNIGVPADNPYNIFGVPVGSASTNGLENSTQRIRSRLIETGNRVFDSQSSSWHFVAGGKGNVLDDKLHYDISADYSQTTQNQIQNSASSVLLNEALTPMPGSTTLSQLVGANGQHVPIYNIFALPGFNDPATVQAIKAADGQGGFSDLLDVIGIFNFDLFSLPAGTFKLAAGGQWSHETLETTAGALLSSGNLIGLLNVPPFAGGSRDRYAGFVEGRIPVFSPDQDIPGFHSLEITAAGRYEVVESQGVSHDSLVPKVGVRWQPLDEQFTLRGTYSQGFVVEPLIQLYGPPLNSSPTIVTPTSATDLTPVAQQENVNFLTNPDLAPSHAETYTAGIVISPKIIKNLTVSVDWYKIQETDVPFYPSGSSVIADLNANGANSKWATDPNLHGTPIYTSGGAPYFPTPGNPASFITAENFDTLNLPLIGGGAIRTEGIDFGLNYHLDAKSAGNADIFVNANLVLTYDVALPGNPYYSYKGQYTDPQLVPAYQGLIPDYNITMGFTWHLLNFDYTIIAHYVPATTDLGDTHPSIGSPVNDFTLSGKPFAISDYYKIDMQLAYNFHSDTGKKWYDNTRIAVGCNNVTDEQVPVIASSSEDNTDKSSFDIIGRFVYFELSKKF
jgi:iron complex outermembrane receptor protein